MEDLKYVICIDNKRLKSKLVLGEKYYIIAEHNRIWKEGKIQDCWHIECRDGSCRSYPKYRFVEADSCPST